MRVVSPGRSRAHARATLAVAVVLLAVFLPAPVVAAAPYQPGPLAWPAPPMQPGPGTITYVVNAVTTNPSNQGSCSELPGGGICKLDVPAGKDALVVLPQRQKRYGGVWVNGGHNVRIVGGYITIPQHSTSTGWQKRAIRISGSTGIVHIEGVLLDASGDILDAGCGTSWCGSSFDGIQVGAPLAVIQVENVRITDPVVSRMPNGAPHHGDAMEATGGFASLRVDRMTTQAKFNNFRLRQESGPIGALTFRRTNVALLGERSSEHAMEIGLGPTAGCPPAAAGCAAKGDRDPDNCRPGTGSGWRIDVSGGFYVSAPAGTDYHDLVSPGSNPACPVALVAGQLTWPHWAGPGVAPTREQGRITLGAPRAGDWAPACANNPVTSGFCPGLFYRSPGAR